MEHLRIMLPLSCILPELGCGSCLLVCNFLLLFFSWCQFVEFWVCSCYKNCEDSDFWGGKHLFHSAVSFILGVNQ